MRKAGGFFILFIAISTLLCCKTIYNGDQNGTEVTPISSEGDAAKMAQIELGRHLFYDVAMSRDSSVSCAVCHKQDLAFTDGLPQSIGIKDRVGTRNAPTLANVGNRPYFLLDGVNPSLEAQITAPIQEHAEFDFHVLLIVERMKMNPKYVALAKAGFDSEINEQTVYQSIAQFERTMISNNSPYDQYLAGNKAALNKQQKKGLKIFNEKLYCAKCHFGNDLTNDALTNNGLYTQYADSGRMRLTHTEADRAIFKVPTLRNIAVTAPYMHNGSIESLDAVLNHYMTGGKTHANKSEIIQPFTLSEEEKNDLVQFLHALTDSTFLTNSSFADPINN